MPAELRRTPINGVFELHAKPFADHRGAFLNAFRAQEPAFMGSWGDGAAHKGNTFLNAAGEASKTLVYVVDASPEKQGKYLPGSQVPVLSPNQLGSANPTDVLILPWNIAPELARLIGKITPSGRIWVVQPAMCQLQN